MARQAIFNRLIANVLQTRASSRILMQISCLSEAMMLLTTQVQVALFDDDPDTAESALKMMCQIALEDDPRVVQLREKIDLYRLPEILSRGQTDAGP